MPTLPIRSFDLNLTGRDFVVGDIHGQFSKLEKALTHYGFSPKLGDRLFHVGDLVDRGHESFRALDWLDKPWVYSIRGNHEQMLIDNAKGELSDHVVYYNGGGWFLDLEPQFQKIYADRFSQLPFAFEIQSPHGLIVMVHADIELNSWAEAKELYQTSEDARDYLHHTMLWSRERIKGNLPIEPVEDVYQLVCGHTSLPEPRLFANRLLMDTGGWQEGRNFALYDLTSGQILHDKSFF